MASQRQIQSSDQKTEQVSIPPHSTEAEQAVLGGIMLSNQHWDGIAERVMLRIFILLHIKPSSKLWKN